MTSLGCPSENPGTFGERRSDMRRFRNLTMAALMAMVLVTYGGSAFGWTPSKPVELVVPAAPGGGSDVMARMMASIIEAEKLCPVPFIVVNRPGGGSTVGMVSVAQQKGNPYTLMTYHSGMMMAGITSGVDLTRFKNYTPIASIAIDEQLIVVREDAPYKTAKDFIRVAKEKGGTVPVAGTYTGQDDHVCNRLLEIAANVKFRFVPFNSGGEVVTALLGGHVEAIWANPSEFAPNMEAKQVRPLGVAKEERLPYLSGTPTLKEQGYDTTWKMFRGVVAPPEIPSEVKDYYENLFKRLSDSQKWRDGYVKKYMLTPSWMGSQEFKSYVDRQEELSINILKELNLLK
jgi:putative tricarboxylic transport membrane protein